MRHDKRRPVAALTRVAAIAVASIATLPLVYLVMRAAQGGAAMWIHHVVSARVAELLRGTGSLVAAVAVLSICIALPYAWLVTRTDLPARRAWAVAGALPLVFPSYIAAFSLVAVLGPRGELARVIGSEIPEIAYGFSGAVLALGFFSYSYLYLLLVPAIRAIDPSLEEVSRSLGVSRGATFRRVVMPQLRAPLAAGTLLVVLYTLSDFGAVSIVRYDTFTTAIYDAYRGLFDRTVAAVLATVLVAVTLAVLTAEWLFVRRLPPLVVRPVRRPERMRLGVWTAPALLFTSTVTLLSLGVPLFAIGSWMLRGESGTGDGLSLELIRNSFGVSAAAAVAAAALSLPAAIWITRGRTRAASVIERLTYSGYALPGIVIALALVFFSIRLIPFLYQTPALLVIAYVVRFLPEALSASRSSLAAVSPVFEEAARTLGTSRPGVLRRVTIPMIMPGVLAGAGLVFLTAMKELPATLVLRPAGFETLATRVWTEAGVSAWSGAAMPALVLLLVSAVPIWALVIRPVVRFEK